MNKLNLQDEESVKQALKIRAVVTFVMLFLLIFGIAGRVNYWQGWFVYFSYLVTTSVSTSFFKDKTDLMKERMKPGEGIKSWDKLFMLFFIPAMVSVFIVGSLDTGRFFWTEGLPVWIYVVGFVLFIISSLLMHWSMYINNYFSSYVRIQKDRGHIVVKEGPYKMVRHPGYTGIIIGACALPMMFGSEYAFIPAVCMMILTIIRTYLEDKTLNDELEGYSEYKAETKYRLIPFIW